MYFAHYNYSLIYTGDIAAHSSLCRWSSHRPQTFFIIVILFKVDFWSHHFKCSSGCEAGLGTVLHRHSNALLLATRTCRLVVLKYLVIVLLKTLFPQSILYFSLHLIHLAVVAFLIYLTMA